MGRFQVTCEFNSALICLPFLATWEWQYGRTLYVDDIGIVKKANERKRTLEVLWFEYQNRLRILIHYQMHVIKELDFALVGGAGSGSQYRENKFSRTEI